MSKVAVIGDYDSIYGFGAVGLAVFATPDAESAGKSLHQIAESGYDVIFMTENYYSQLTKEIERYSERITPAIIPIPGAYGNTGAGVSEVKSNVTRAVGSDILFGDM